MYLFKAQKSFICILAVLKPWFRLSDPRNPHRKKAFHCIPDWSYNRLWIPGNKLAAFQQHAVWLRYLQCLNQVTVFSLDAAQHQGCGNWSKTSCEPTGSVNIYLFKTWRKMLKLVNLACPHDRLRLCIQSAIKAQGMSIKTEHTQLSCPYLSVSCHLKAWENPSCIGWQEKTVFLRWQVELRRGISQTWTDTKHPHCRQTNLSNIIVMTELQTQLLTHKCPFV